MRSLWLGIPLAIFESLACGQLNSDKLTVSVSQSINLQPDQILFYVSFHTSASTGLSNFRWVDLKYRLNRNERNNVQWQV
jgi:hypothetical protein